LPYHKKLARFTITSFSSENFGISLISEYRKPVDQFKLNRVSHGKRALSTTEDHKFLREGRYSLAEIRNLAKQKGLKHAQRNALLEC
jgi:hypothetical protein